MPHVVSRNITIPYPIPDIRKVDINKRPFYEVDGTAFLREGVCPWITGDFTGEQIASFHNCFDKLSYLNSGSTASAIKAIPGREGSKAPVHAKLDRSGYSFIGRSYGTGGSVGFVNMSDILSPLSYSFTETGFHAQVQCTVNKTAAFRLREEKSNMGLQVYETIGDGTLPEGLDANIGFFGSTSKHFGYLSDDVFAWASAHNNRSTSWISLAAVPRNCTGENRTDCSVYGFMQLHKTQCKLDFSAKMFELDVNNIARTITVTPKEDIAWPSYANALLTQFAFEHSYISFNDGAFGGSTLGKAIRSNIGILRASRNETNVTTDTMLQGVSDFIADLVDNTLLTFWQSRYFGENETSIVDAQLARNVVVYGDAKFIWAVMALNFLIVVLCCGEAVRTRSWKDLPPLDLLDVASVAVGASAGGLDLAAHVQSMGVTRVLYRSREVAGAVKVRLTNVDGVWCSIVPDDERSGAEGDGLKLIQSSQKYRSVPDTEH